MKKIKFVLFLALFNISFTYSQTLKEIEVRNNKIQICGSELNEKNIKKILIKDCEANLLYEEDVYLQDNESFYSLFLSENLFVMKFKKYVNKFPENFLIYFNGTTKEVRKIEIEDNWVSCVVCTDRKIFYSTEFKDDTIFCYDLNKNSGEYLKGYFPNAELNVLDAQKDIVSFSYNGSDYLIREGRIELKTGK